LGVFTGRSRAFVALRTGVVAGSHRPVGFGDGPGPRQMGFGVDRKTRWVFVRLPDQIWFSHRGKTHGIWGGVGVAVGLMELKVHYLAALLGRWRPCTDRPNGTDPAKEFGASRNMHDNNLLRMTKCTATIKRGH